MSRALQHGEIIGLVKPAVDAHTLGLATVRSLLGDCGFACVDAPAHINALVDRPLHSEDVGVIEAWVRSAGVTRLGFSYRLDPGEGVEKFERLVWALGASALLVDRGGPIRSLYFAGLPEACRAAAERLGDQVVVFAGDEADHETLLKLGVPPERITASMRDSAAYDEARLSFGREVLTRGLADAVRPRDDAAYPGFGTRSDTLEARLTDAHARGLGPLMRAHVGPYDEDRERAVRQMIAWARMLAQAGHLDILSLGTSQLTQSHFGQDWSGLANGGGVPIQNADEYRSISEAALPMLVRTYSGTRNVPALARIHERELNIAWHALSFWWFCSLDGRGPNDLAANLRQHVETCAYIASTGKPLEPNVPHHFMFRGADDVTYVVSAVLAARAAAAAGVRHLVLQTMLNTPKRTSGVADLARVRSILSILRSSDLRGMRITLQPRAGLDYFSPDLDLARSQLAAASALMDDIEPSDPASPAIVHVVSFCEAAYLATPPEVDESVRITRAALRHYRRLREKGEIENMASNAEAAQRQEVLERDARLTLHEIEESVPSPYSAEGLRLIFAAGFLPVPHLWHCREEFPEAVRRQTALIGGAVRVVDDAGKPIPTAQRVAEASDIARRLARADALS